MSHFVRENILVLPLQERVLGRIQVVVDAVKRGSPAVVRIPEEKSIYKRWGAFTSCTLGYAYLNALGLPCMHLLFHAKLYQAPAIKNGHFTCSCYFVLYNVHRKKVTGTRFHN